PISETAPERAGGAASPCSEPGQQQAFAGLFGVFSDLDAREREERIAALFGVPRLDCEIARVADELALLVVTDPAVRAAFNPLIGRQRPSARAYEAARSAVLESDMSRQLRGMVGRSRPR